MTKPNPTVDILLSRAEQWQEEMQQIREILLDCDLAEHVKWGVPCYMHDDQNIVLMHGFKEYCAVLFFKGALLKDPQGVLVQQTKNVQAARQMRFTNVWDVVDREAALRAFVLEAIAVEAAGLKVKFKEASEFPVPAEFQARLHAMPALRDAFQALTPGRQKGYLLHFSSAKQSKTRESRVEKCVPLIMDGLGLDD